MPTVDRDGVTLFYETAGERADGDAGGEPVVFVSAVGVGAWLWSWQAPAIAGPRQTLVWDLRGTGRSDAPAGPYDVPELAADCEAVVAAAGFDRVHLVGAGLGGAIALRYAQTFDRARSLTLLCTPPTGAAIDEAALRALHPSDRTASALDEALAGAFTTEFRDARPDIVATIRDWRREEDANPAAVDAQIAALTAFDPGPLHEVTVPALVLYGADDPVLAPAAASRLASELPRGAGEGVAGRHYCFLENATPVTDRLLAHVHEAE